MAILGGRDKIDDDGGGVRSTPAAFFSIALHGRGDPAADELYRLHLVTDNTCIRRCLRVRHRLPLIFVHDVNVQSNFCKL